MAALLGAVLLTACAAQGPEEVAQATASRARPPMAEVLGRLPVEVAGFERGATTNLEQQRPGYGSAVEYTTPARNGLPARAAVASVLIYDLGQPPLPDRAAAVLVTPRLDEAVREATELPPGRTLAETSRRSLLLPDGGSLTCADLSGSFGRTAVEQQVCLGTAAGRFLRVHVTMPSRNSSVADADDFTRAIATAARALPVTRAF
ncbi:hypothetical protein [Roseomonas marmotae]|uniref:Uncharacterized protein n=1 Tax=Roseomonas marmotae TaxID=2768161 RepID=A0ABS3K9A2_9PROT|nr:hypothetical protein [Roseomonas marmotae]MBO1074041.1 hypothetical protein [Roseomonas marmotae]QTI78827.1 hypothetical protein IAI58_14390 [Roseomonas marmotae]